MRYKSQKGVSFFDEISRVVIDSAVMMEANRQLRNNVEICGIFVFEKDKVIDCLCDDFKKYGEIAFARASTWNSSNHRIAPSGVSLKHVIWRFIQLWKELKAFLKKNRRLKVLSTTAKDDFFKLLDKQKVLSARCTYSTLEAQRVPSHTNGKKLVHLRIAGVKLSASKTKSITLERANVELMVISDCRSRGPYEPSRKRVKGL